MEAVDEENEREKRLPGPSTKKRRREDDVMECHVVIPSEEQAAVIQPNTTLKPELVQLFLLEDMVHPLNSGELPKAQLVITDPPYGILDPALHSHDVVSFNAIERYVSLSTADVLLWNNN